MRYAIENTSGQWWTGSCWGVKEAREEYFAVDLPESIDIDNDDSAFSGDEAERECNGDIIDTFYSTADSDDTIASVREVR